MSYGDGPGIESEQLIRELITKSGWRVLETRKASDEGKAPMLQSDGGAVRLPDFQAVRPDPAPQYVEVKSKREAIEFGVENSVRHGYERPKHRDYIEMAEASDTPVWLFVHERNTGVVLRQRVRDMDAVGSVTDDDTLRQSFNTTEPMLFFERDSFEVVTDDISQFGSGFGQGGLLQPEIDLNPFGYDPDGDQGTLDRWGGGDE
jgi:hypothetical protein